MNVVLQSSYSLEPEIGFAGQLVGHADIDSVSRAAEGVIGFGKVVSRGTDKTKQCVIGGSDILGVSIRSIEREVNPLTGEAEYNEGEQVAILRVGSLFVRVQSGVTAGDQACYNTTTGEIKPGSAGAGEADLVGMYFDTDAAAGGVAVLRVRGL